MFEHYVDFQKPRRPLWVRIAIAASVIAHVGAATALIVTAAWRINKLSIDDTGISVAAFGLPSAAPPALAAKKLDKKPLTRTEDLAQPEDETPNRVTSSKAGDVGDENGHEDGEVGSTGVTPGAPRSSILGCAGVECLSSTTPPVPKRETVVRPVVVPQETMKARLLSGETQIRPSNEVKIKLDRAGKSSTLGIVKACIGESGRVTSVKVLKSTGHRSYDQKLTAAVRRWSYRPYRVNGKAIQVCTTVSFLYRMNP